MARAVTGMPPRPWWARGARYGLAALASLAVIGGCDEGGAPEATSQEDYLATARAFESERAEYAEEVVSCAAEQGVDAKASWDHGLVLPPGLQEEEEISQYWEVVGGCAEDVYPPERDPSPEEVEEQYALLLAAKECLEEEGFETTEPSGIEDFQSAYESGGSQLPWSPYELVVEREETFRSAVEVCPQPGRF